MTDAKPAPAEKPRWKRNRWMHELRQGDRLLGYVEKTKGRRQWLWGVRRPPSTAGIAETYAAARRQVEELCGIAHDEAKAK